MNKTYSIRQKTDYYTFTECIKNQMEHNENETKITLTKDKNGKVVICYQYKQTPREKPSVSMTFSEVQRLRQIQETKKLLDNKVI